MTREHPIDILKPDTYQHAIPNGTGGNSYIQASPLAINYLASFIAEFEITYKRKAKILEWGDGISTLWLAKTFPDNEVYSVGGDKEWFDLVDKELKELPLHNTTHIFEEQTNFYSTVAEFNMDYIHTVDNFKPFDLIINDGGMREVIGDHVLSNLDSYIQEGGIYLRHDYEMAIFNTWRGLRVDLPEWCRDETDLGYEGFCASHPKYNMITVTGNGRWGTVTEYGGVWHKVDHKWKRRVDATREREASEAINN